MQNQIDVVLFDLGNVLILFSHEKMFAQISSLTGIDQVTVKELFLQQGLMKELETGAISSEVFAERFRNRASKAFTNEQLYFAMSDIFTANSPMIDVLKKLKRMGKMLILVSNTSAIHFTSEKDSQPWLALFDETVLSYEIGVMKPDSAFYEHAKKLTGTNPARCLFVDDLAANCEGARRAGFRSHLFTSVENFVAEFAWLA